MTSPVKPASSASFALFVLFAINLLNFFDRQLPGALAEPIRKEFHLSDTALGLLATVATLMYALVGLPLGRLADKWSRTRLIAMGTAAWSLLTAASGLAQNYTQLFVSRLGVGLGEATCAPAGQSLIGDLFSAASARPAPWVYSCSVCPPVCLSPTSAPAPSAPRSAGARRSSSPASRGCCSPGSRCGFPNPRAAPWMPRAQPPPPRPR